jgi:hypothetical protein
MRTNILIFAGICISFIFCIADTTGNFGDAMIPNYNGNSTSLDYNTTALGSVVPLDMNNLTALNGNTTIIQGRGLYSGSNGGSGGPVHIRIHINGHPNGH